MPYIAPTDRERFEEDIQSICDNLLMTAGEMNYVISTLMSKYMDAVKEAEGKVSYYHLNQLIGVLECAKLELYRRVAAPYEDIKIDENGDVYDVPKEQ